MAEGAARLGLALAAAVWIAAGSGCAHFRKPPPTVEPSLAAEVSVASVSEEAPEAAVAGGSPEAKAG